jgi:hypothetical protein
MNQRPGVSRELLRTLLIAIVCYGIVVALWWYQR